VTAVEWAQLLGGAGEILGAIAVVVTLVYLSRQVRQNTTGLRASAYQTWVAASTAHFSAALASETLGRTIMQGLEDPAGLTEDNWLQFAFWCHHFVLITEATFHLHQDDVVPATMYEKELQRVISLLDSLGGQQWWRAGARTQFSPDFVESLERAAAAGSTIQRYAFAPGRGFFPHGEALPASDSQANHDS